MTNSEKVQIIPFIENCWISRNGKIYKNENGSATLLNNYFKKFMYIDIDGISYRVDELLLRTFIGQCPYPILYKDNDKKNCALNNITYKIYKKEIINSFLYMNDIAFPFKYVEGSNDMFISVTGVLYDLINNKFKPIKFRNNNYRSFRIKLYGKEYDYLLHRLVYSTWKGEIFPDYVIDHIDGNKWNNFIFNLDMITHGENNLRAFKSGLKSVKWINEIIHVICRMIENNYEISEIYKLLGAKSLDEKRKVSNLIYDILNKDSHKDVSDNYKLDRYDVKKNHYNVLNDRDKRIAKKLLFEFGFSQDKTAKILEVSRGAIQNFKEKCELTFNDCRKLDIHNHRNM